MEQLALGAVALGGLVVLLLVWAPGPPSRRGASVVVSLFACSLIINQSWLGTYETIIGGAVITIAAGGIHAASRSTDRSRITWAQWLILLIPLQLFFVDALLNFNRSDFDVFARLLPFVVLIPVAAVLTAPDRLTAVQAALQTAFAFACVLSALAPEAWVHCSVFKCSVAQRLFVGPFASENVLGGIAGLAAVASTSDPRRRVRWATLLLAVLVLVVTNSRTSQVAALFAVLAMGMTAVFRKKSVSTPFRRPLALAFAAAPTLLGVHLVFTAASTDFSNRGRIWLLGRRALDDAFLTGKGMSSWPRSELYDAFMHSQNLLLLYSGGVVALVAWVVVCALAIRNGSTISAPLAVGFLTLVLTRGLIELVWNPLALDFTGLFVIPLLALVVPSTSPSTSPTDAVGQRQLTKLSPQKARH